MSINPSTDQQKAITNTEGPQLIIAGPGSGKTFTLVQRIFHVIKEQGLSPESLFVATFTNKAAKELTTRLSDLLLREGIRFNVNEMYLGTFHSICLRILEEQRAYTRLKRNFTLMDQFDQQYFIFQNLKKFNALDTIELIITNPKTSSWRKAEIIQKHLNLVAEEAIPLHRLMEASEEDIRVLGKLYTLYQQLLDDANALDFSSIQLECFNLFNNEPEVLKEYQQELRYLMVDEYQDTNTIQELLLMSLKGGKEQPLRCWR